MRPPELLGVDANKAQNKSVLDSLEAPQLERAPKRCGPKHFDPAAGPLYIYCRRMPLQAEGTEGLWAATTDSLLVQALKHESKSTGPNSHPAPVAGLLEVGKVLARHCLGGPTTRLR